MNILILSLTVVFGIISFGLVDSVYAEHPDEVSELVVDIRVNNCTSFTIFGNTDENDPIMIRYGFFEYLGKDRTSLEYHNQNGYHVLLPDNKGYFEHTHTMPITYKSGYSVSSGVETGEYVFTYPGDNHTITEVYQGTVIIHFQQYYFKPHSSLFVHHESLAIHNNTEIKYDGIKLKVRTNPDTSQLCFYLDNENTPSLTLTEPPKTKLQIANEEIEKLETKKEKKIELKNKWKEKFNTCFDKKERIKNELKTEREYSAQYYNEMLEYQYENSNYHAWINGNLTIANNEIRDLKNDKIFFGNMLITKQITIDEQQHTIEKLTTELNEAKKKIEELES